MILSCEAHDDMVDDAMHPKPKEGDMESFITIAGIEHPVDAGTDGVDVDDDADEDDDDDDDVFLFLTVAQVDATHPPKANDEDDVSFCPTHLVKEDCGVA